MPSPTLLDDAPPAGQAPVPPTLPDARSPRSPSPSPRRRRWPIALAVVSALLAALAAAALLLRGTILRAMVERQAARAGIELQFDDLTWEDKALRLQKVRATLIGVPGLVATIDKARIGLDGLDPRSIEAEGAVITAVGSAPEKALALSAWTTEYPALYRVPGSARNVRITWADRPSAEPWLIIQGGSLTSTGTGATFTADSTKVENATIGAVGAVWAADAKTITVGIGKTDIATAPLQSILRPMDSPPSAEIKLLPVKLADLGAPMGIALPAPGATVSGSAKLILGKHAGKDAILGSMAVLVDGWIPPHPKELDGIVFGRQTTFTTGFRISEDRARVTLEDAAVKAGAFELKGKGTIDRGADWALAKMDMNGTIPCSAVARSAAMANVGGALGQLLGDVAQGAMKGSVAVKVKIEADSRNLLAAKVIHEIGVGCGIRGL